MSIAIATAQPDSETELCTSASDTDVEIRQPTTYASAVHATNAAHADQAEALLRGIAVRVLLGWGKY